MASPDVTMGEENTDVTFDLGNMTCFDAAQPSSYTEDVLMEHATERCQALVGQLFELPSEAADGGRLAELPYPSYAIPREKPPPSEKEKTKWEQFREEKGIRKKKKESKKWDEEKQEFVQAYGAKRAKIEKQHDWIREVPDNYQPKVEGGDAFLDAKMEKKERIAKNKANQAANQRRAKENTKLLDIKTATSRLATASMGKFDMKGSTKMKKVAQKAKGTKKSKTSQRSRR
eukprot:Rhum_TRINITY_DN7922_c0_g1::Rhum_TRINITY_DN7922_c0_g1_i1::g.25046::m.25046/K14852/RRS1; regulator of ribosome biosynthesis